MNIDINQNYWLTIEPYVYINFSQSSVLLYNTLDAEHIESSSSTIVQLVQKITEKENCGVSQLTNQELENKEIKNFVINIREKFIGDILPIGLSENKPIQLTPFLNFQQDKTRLNLQANISIGDNILSYLHEVNFILDKNNEFNIAVFNEVIEQLHGVPAINLCKNLLGYSQVPALLNSLSKTNGKKTIVNNYQDLDIDNLLLANIEEEYSFLISVKFPINKYHWNSLIPLLLSKWEIKFEFEIEKEEDLSEVDQLVNNYSIENYQLKPIYNYKNIDFFIKNVYLTKSDIFSSPLSMKEIFANQTLNTYNFGRLYIMSNGNVFTKGNKEPIGNVNKDTIKRIILNEISIGNSWLNTRKSQPCSDCLYQWLCPSPSDYEIAIGKPNLCHVHI